MNAWMSSIICCTTGSAPRKSITGLSSPVSGRNSWGKAGYGGPCPPKGHGPHRYFFRLYALDVAKVGLKEAVLRRDAAFGDGDVRYEE